jgi:uncharacterized protein
MFRNLFLLVAVIAIFWIVKGFIRRANNKPQTKISSKDMVQCEHCNAYLPKDDAIVMDNKAFCNQQHLNDWKADK